MFDATKLLIYHPERMDTKKALWFVRDVPDVDALQDNAVTCLNQDDLPKCKEFFEAFPSVFVAISDAEAAEEISQKLADCMPEAQICTPAPGAFGNFRYVREALQEGGRRRADHIMLGAVERPMDGLLNLAEVEALDMSQQPVISSKIPELDRAIGGFYAGELSIWTGKRGGGKSTILGQQLLNAMDQGTPVCAYSGELAAGRFKDWIVQQAAGPDFVTPVLDSISGKTHFAITNEIKSKINKWLDGMFFLYDNRVANAHEENSIIRVFEYAMRKYGCCVYMVDNLMTARFNGKESEFYRRQSLFTGRLAEFAKKNEVHVHLVAHPRKGELKEADDVSGSGDITNRADNVFFVKRLSDEDAEKYGFHVGIEVQKNRDFGETVKVKMNYDERSRRFYRPESSPGAIHYGWERQPR